MIEVQCPQCGKRFQAPEKLAGQSAKCKTCGAQIDIPAARLMPPLIMDDPDREIRIIEPVIQGDQVLPLATPAVVCGFAGLAIPGVNIAAIVMGVISVSKFDDQQHRPGDHSKAVTGIVLGIAGLLMQFIALLAGLVMMCMASRSVQQQSPANIAIMQQTPAVVQMDELLAGPSPTANLPPLPSPALRRSGNIYYYDLNTGQLFSDKSKQIAPIPAPSDDPAGTATSGVKAYVFSCGDCADKKQRIVAWMERFIPAAKELQEQGENATLQIDGLIDSLTAPLEVSSDGKHWQKIHPINYIKYQLRISQGLCGSGNAVKCKPP